MSIVMRSLARWYQGSVAKELKKFGLHYEDLLNESHPDVETAISRLSAEELSNRNKRIKRAMDLSLKHAELSKEVQDTIDPWKSYLPIDRAMQERLERAAYK